MLTSAFKPFFIGKDTIHWAPMMLDTGLIMLSTLSCYQSSWQWFKKKIEPKKFVWFDQGHLANKWLNWD